MIRHIVMWRLKNSRRNAPKLKSMLEGLRRKIPQIKEMEAGVNFSSSDFSADVVLYSAFDDEAALAAYRDHPDHIKVAEFLSSVATERRVADYKIL